MYRWAGRTAHGPRPDTRLSRGLPSASRGMDESVSGGPGWERQGMTPPRWWLGGWSQVPGPSEDPMSEQGPQDNLWGWTGATPAGSLVKGASVRTQAPEAAAEFTGGGGCFRVESQDCSC